MASEQILVRNEAITLDDGYGKALYFDLTLRRENGQVKRDEVAEWLTDELELVEPSKSNLLNWDDLTFQEATYIRSHLNEFLNKILNVRRPKTNQEYYSLMRNGRLAITVPHPVVLDSDVTIQRAVHQLAAALGLSHYYLERRNWFDLNHSSDKKYEHVFHVMITPQDPQGGDIEDQFLQAFGVVVVDTLGERQALLRVLWKKVDDLVVIGRKAKDIQSDEDVLEMLSDLEQHWKASESDEDILKAVRRELSISVDAAISEGKLMICARAA